MVSSISSTSPITTNIISPPKPKKTTQDIIDKKLQEEAILAKAKPDSERTWEDYLSIAFYELSKIKDYNPVVYANSNINYLA